MFDLEAFLATEQDPEIREHMRRLHAALFDTYDLKDVVRYLTEKTFLSGDRFSFTDHEFQRDILSDTSLDINVQKCAQIGMTEAMARYGLAVCRIMPYFSVIMTMPFAGDASNFAKTRMAPIINNSPDLRDVMDGDLNNSEVKAIGNSLLYLRGCSGTTAALSVPADMLIHDEVDRSDPAILAQYQSRLKHSRWKLTRKFGTPTAEGRGIAAAMAGSKRKRHMVKCDHCNHTFAPSYHNDVKIPGFDGDKKEITKFTLPDIRWREAMLLCPKCGRIPSLQFDRREWVMENPDDNFDSIGYFVTPFSVPNVVTISSLVRESTRYDGWTEFCNQALGETASDNDKQLTRPDVEETCVRVPLESTELHCMGIDVGQWCHITVGRITQAGEFLVVWKERCVLAKLSDRKIALASRFRCITTVIDAFPETNMVFQMQAVDKNLYGGVYHANYKLPTYEIKMVEEDLKEGKLPINQASIHRNKNFDEVMALFKTKKLIWAATDESDDRLFVEHCLDMTRMQEMNNTHKGLVYVWEKSLAGQDHYMHALGYLHVACRLMPTASHSISFGSGMQMFRTFQVIRHPLN